jgi:hypothetical protein
MRRSTASGVCPESLHPSENRFRCFAGELLINNGPKKALVGMLRLLPFRRKNSHAANQFPQAPVDAGKFPHHMIGVNRIVSFCHVE